jgi:hypothetical protein
MITAFHIAMLAVLKPRSQGEASSQAPSARLTHSSHGWNAISAAAARIAIPAPTTWAFQACSAVANLQRPGRDQDPQPEHQVAPVLPAFRHDPSPSCELVDATDTT